MELTVENRDDFLDFAQDLLRANDELPALIAQITLEPSEKKLVFFHHKMKTLATEARLMNIRPLFSAFNLLTRLSGAIAAETTTVDEDGMKIVSSLFSSLAATTRKWEAILTAPDDAMPATIEYSIDQELLESADACFSKKNFSNMLDENDAVPSLPPGMITEYVAEGFSFLSSLQAAMDGCENRNSAAGELRHHLAMFKGNGDVLVNTLQPDTSYTHPAHRIVAIAGGLLKITDIVAERGQFLSADAIALLADSLTELEYLLDCLRDSQTPETDHRELTDRLKEQYNAIYTLEADEEIVPMEDSTVFQHTEKQDSRPLASPEKKNTPPLQPLEETFIPIKLERMEDLGNLVGELFVEKNSFVNLRDFIYQNDFAKTDAFLKKTEDSFQRIISDLDSVVMKMRMQKVKTLFQRFPRVVRDLSKKLEKEVDLVFSGEDTEIDNRILGAVTDPMMHLVRNAMDHGVEIPAKREKAGKNRKGTIQLSARNMDNRIVIEIFDDGNGIDPAVIKKKAVEKGVITEQEADILTDPQARELIFHPGFSTAEQVTEVSGRGVGMDVVLDNIRKVNGSIALESETGRYSRVTLTLPTTISVSRGLKVCFGRDIYLLPMDSVVKMIAIEAKNVHRTPSSVFVETGGAVYPVLPLNSSMGYRSPVDSPNEFINLILVKGEKKKACVAVDRIVGIEDIVVKPLPPISSGVKDFYSGCSILSDGSVVLIINIDNYLNRGML